MPRTRAMLPEFTARSSAPHRAVIEKRALSRRRYLARDADMPPVPSTMPLRDIIIATYLLAFLSIAPATYFFVFAAS